MYVVHLTRSYIAFSGGGTLFMLFLQACDVSITIHVCPAPRWCTKSSVTWCNKNHLKLNVNRIKALEINKIENIDCSHNPSSADL